MKTEEYLHGYTATERQRLNQQAGFLEDMIYEFLDLRSARKMLEVGCGTGAQSKILLHKYPQLQIDAIDINEEQIAGAKTEFEKHPSIKDRINFFVSDGHSLHFEKESYDSIFIVWVLEHIKDPTNLLKSLIQYLRPEGKIYVTEVYNNSLFISPEAKFQMEYYKRYCELQEEMGGHPNIGMQLGNLLYDAGFQKIKTRNLNRHYDKSRPEAKIMMFDYWKSLLLSAKKSLSKANKIDEQFLANTLEEIDLIKNMEDSIFYYCPIQAEACK